jgi:cellulose synthase/poly-beta-1,6-N-acetylglucosamine synthase-like glycosyltransferase
MITSVLSAAGVICAAISLLASLYILGLALLGVRWRNRADGVLRRGHGQTQFLVMIPAHNEESGIQSTIESAQKLVYPSEKRRVVVIADNCDDSTAAVAEQCGAEVWVRNDMQNRGKGQALAWALERAADLSFDMLAVIDADSRIDPEFLRAIDGAYERAPHDEGIVFQGRYEFAAAHDSAGWFETFTLASKEAENSFVYRPRSQMGLMNLLQGNGFCVSRRALRDVPFAASSVVEDAEYAVSLALHGLRVRYVDEARVVSRTTRNIRDAAPQRLRWATGIFQLIGRSVPKLLRQALGRGDWRLAEGALMMLLTSRLVVVYLTLAALLCTALSLNGAHTRLSAILLLITCVLQCVYLFLTFRKAGREPHALSSLLFMPFYVTLICIAQAAALLGFKRRQWSRTVR